ncbi:MAG: DUF1580 domain-containing protein [Planctomycetota bacterium]
MQPQNIDINNRKSLVEAGRLAGVSPSTIFRWITVGVDGVKLQHARLGRRVYTSEPALSKFMNEVAQAREAVA